MAAAGTSGFASMEERGYFLLLDRLQCTLEHKIDHWRNFEKALSLDNGKKRRSFLAERLHVAFDVAAALSYLHSNNIIYRCVSFLRKRSPLSWMLANTLFH